MKNLNYLRILLGLLILTTSLAIFGFLKKPEKVPVETNNSNKTDGLTVEKSKMWDSYIEYIKSEGDTVPDSIKVSDTSGNIYSIKALLNKRSKIVIRYSFKDCDICVDTIFNKIAFYKKNQKLKDVLIITNSASERDYIIKVAYDKHDLKIYNLKAESMGLNIENKNFPFMFVLSPDLKISKIFVPAKEIPEQMNGYFDFVVPYLKKVNKS